MRRRTVAVAAALLVAVVVAGVAVLAGTLGSETPEAQRPVTESIASSSPRDEAASTADPSAADSLAARPALERFTPAAYDGWRTGIPDDVSVRNGLPDAGGDFTRSGEPVTGEFCGTEAFPPGAELDVLRDGAVGPEFWDARDLRLYDDDRAAHRFLADATRLVASCPEERPFGSTWRNDLRAGTLGEESVLLVRTYEDDGLVSIGASFWHLVRVGNAVLLTGASGEYLPGETLGTGIRDQQRLLEPVVASMCVFGAEGCGNGGSVVALRPGGVGPFEIGMTTAEAEALGARVEPARNGTGCDLFEAEVEGTTVRGSFDGPLGLAVVSGEGLGTSDGIGPASTLAEVRTTYAHLVGDPDFLLVAKVSDRTRYRFEMVRGRVDNVMLLHEQQGCGG